MNTVRHLARAVASTGSAAPAYRVDLRIRTHELVADEPYDADGGDLGPTPFELLAGALAACTATTLRMYATRKGWDLTTIDVDIRVDLDPENHVTIVRTITIPAEFTPEQRARLEDIAERTPVTATIRDGAPITTTFVARNH
jgi:putative redox protein